MGYWRAQGTPNLCTPTLFMWYVSPLEGTSAEIKQNRGLVQGGREASPEPPVASSASMSPVRAAFPTHQDGRLTRAPHIPVSNRDTAPHAHLTAQGELTALPHLLLLSSGQ